MYSATIESYKRSVHYVLFHDCWDDFSRLCPEVCDACRAALDGATDRKERRLRFKQALFNHVKELSGDNWLAPIVQNNPLYRTVRTKKPRRDLSAGDDAHFEGVRGIRRLQSLEGLESLERLERLQSLEHLQSLEPALETSNLDYRALTERILTTDDAFVYCDPPYRGTQGYGEFDHDAFLDWALEIGHKRPILISEYAIARDGFIEVDAKQKLCNLCAVTTTIVTEKLYTVKGGVYATQNNIR